jgi:hypothetical protein
MRGIEKAPQVPFSDQLPRVLHDLLGAVASMPAISSTPRRQSCGTTVVGVDGGTEWVKARQYVLIALGGLVGTGS